MGHPSPKNNALGHEVARYEKPRLKLQCVWVHNCALHFYLIDPRVAADSSMVTHCLTNTIESVFEKCKKMQAQAPRQLTVWVSWPILALSSSVSRSHSFVCFRDTVDKFQEPRRTIVHVRTKNNKMDMTSLNFSRVGHTHCCVGPSDSKLDRL